MTTAWGGQPPNLNSSTQTHWGAPSIGLLGSAMKAAWTAGEHGASPLANDSLSDALEYRWYAETVPAGCSVALTELGIAEFFAPADGSYVWTYRLVERGVLLSAVGSVTVSVGAASATVAATGVVAHTGTASIAATVVPAGPGVDASVAATGGVAHTGTAAIAATVTVPGGALSDDEMRQMFTWVSELARIHGLVAGSPLTVTSSTRHAGGITQSISEAGGTVTVSRL